ALNVIRFKAAKYTCEHPLALGAALGLDAARGGSFSLIDGLRAFALPLGEGYQMRDDELGVFGEPDVTGKPAGDDLREGKRTVLTAHTAMGASEADRDFLERSLGNQDLSAADIERLQNLIRSTGALDAVEALIESKSQQALTALAQLEIADDIRAALELIAAKALRRSF
ncbi:MAG: polyprenyl synthetase family protein, partial [Rothia sp. (in: high G+C Gram-positive bacteria)]|nr:polyprenyl synthetase family protein [Rothia sp. (in: high G+C Gram-positive bacteria)]